MVSDAALARKQKFLALKQEHGGNIAGIQEHIKNLDWTLWHDEDGTIISMSKEANSELSEKFEFATFTNDQVNILHDKNWNLYRILTDKYNKHVKFIEVRPVEIDKISSENFFLYQLDKDSSRKYDIKISLSSSNLTITAHKNLLKQYVDIKPSDAVINGRKIIPLYITSKNDPSFMFHSVNISLYDILNNSTIKKELPEDFRGCSVFTLKLFDNYSFNEEKN